MPPPPSEPPPAPPATNGEVARVAGPVAAGSVAPQAEPFLNVRRDGEGLMLEWGLPADTLLPAVQQFNGEWFGPFELPWLYLLPITAFGLVSAVLASVVPAFLASRQDVVAVLAGRRGGGQPGHHRAGGPAGGGRPTGVDAARAVRPPGRAPGG